MSPVEHADAAREGNPWDREVYRDGTFAMHPEYVAALAQQGLGAGASLLIPVPPFGAAGGSEEQAARPTRQMQQPKAANGLIKCMDSLLNG